MNLKLGKLSVTVVVKHFNVLQKLTERINTGHCIQWSNVKYELD